MTTAETIPLFPIPPQSARADGGEAVRRPRSVAWGNCPGCRKGRVGVVRAGAHLAWREHTYTTWGGHRMTCVASGVAVCQATERHPTELIAGRVTCPHEDGGVTA